LLTANGGLRTVAAAWVETGYWEGKLFSTHAAGLGFPKLELLQKFDQCLLILQAQGTEAQDHFACLAAAGKRD
jgi:hypothetical protein